MVRNTGVLISGIQKYKAIPKENLRKTEIQFTEIQTYKFLEIQKYNHRSAEI